MGEAAFAKLFVTAAFGSLFTFGTTSAVGITGIYTGSTAKNYSISGSSVLGATGYSGYATLKFTGVMQQNLVPTTFTRSWISFYDSSTGTRSNESLFYLPGSNASPSNFQPGTYMSYEDIMPITPSSNFRLHMRIDTTTGSIVFFSGCMFSVQYIGTS